MPPPVLHPAGPRQPHRELLQAVLCFHNLQIFLNFLTTSLKIDKNIPLTGKNNMKCDKIKNEQFHLENFENYGRVKIKDYWA